MLNTYTRQTWEEMKLADSEFEKNEHLKGLRDKQSQAERVRLQREKERRELEATRRREDDEQRRLERQVARIRSRDVDTGKKMQQQRAELRRKAEQKEWALLQEYFASRSEHQSLEQKRAAEVCFFFFLPPLHAHTHTELQAEARAAAPGGRIAETRLCPPCRVARQVCAVVLEAWVCDAPHASSHAHFPPPPRRSPEPFNLANGNLSISPR